MLKSDIKLIYIGFFIIFVMDYSPNRIMKIYETVTSVCEKLSFFRGIHLYISNYQWFVDDALFYITKLI